MPWRKVGIPYGGLNIPLAEELFHAEQVHPSDDPGGNGGVPQGLLAGPGDPRILQGRGVDVIDKGFRVWALRGLVGLGRTHGDWRNESRDRRMLFVRSVRGTWRVFPPLGKGIVKVLVSSET
jgi:hypothetical protein